ncbi:hypothetical protein [Halovulum sp. GXIMD14793]
MSNGTDIAAEVAAGLAEAGADTGNGPLISTLEQRTGGPDTPYGAGVATITFAELTGVDFDVMVRDANGELVNETTRMLTVDATGPVPQKGQRVAVGVPMSNADSNNDAMWSRIMAVKPLAPGGVPLLYELALER